MSAIRIFGHLLSAVVFISSNVALATNTKPTLAEKKRTGADHRQFKDTRDGQTYRTVKIGHQIWMAENLRFATPLSFCLDADTRGCGQSGRFYPHSDAVKACPIGWHLPAEQEWMQLDSAAGGKIAANRLAQKGLWKNPWKGSGSDGLYPNNQTGFSARPVGIVHLGNLIESGALTVFWSASLVDGDSSLVYVRHITTQSSRLVQETSPKAGLLASVRCIAD